MQSSRWRLPAIAAVLYFAQGFPFGIANETINLYLAAKNIRPETIGLASIIGLPWTVKFLWAPAVDAFGTYRRWIAAASIVLAVCIATIGAVPPISQAFWIAAVVLAVASATQDIAIDALTIRITPDTSLGPVNSARVAAYRAAMIVAGGGLAILASRGWPFAFMTGAVVPLVVVALIFAIVPAARGDAQKHENPFRALGRWIARPGALLLLVLVLLYRLGDAAILPMIKKFWIIRGYSPAEVGNVTTTLGMICTILGAIAGGAFVARFGIYRGLLWLGIAQMASNAGYAIAAMTNAGRAGMYTVSVIENFTSGLGTASFLAFLMFICDRENAATEYAMLSALFVVTRTFSGALSGFGVTAMGYAGYFWLTTALGVPALLLLPFARNRLQEAKA